MIGFFGIFPIRSIFMLFVVDSLGQESDLFRILKRKTFQNSEDKVSICRGDSI